MYVRMDVLKGGARGPLKDPKGPLWEIEGWAHSAKIF